MLCCSQWNIVHRPHVSIQLCLVLTRWHLHLPPAVLVSCCPHFFLPISFSKYSLVALFLCGLVVSTVVPVWWCCHHFFLTFVQASSIFLFILAPALAPDQFFSHNSLLAVQSGRHILRILRKHLLMKTCNLSEAYLVGVIPDATSRQ